MKQISLTRIVLILALLIAGCATQPTWSRYELFFGLSADSGQTSIPDPLWQQFRDEEIIRRFPDGFTLNPATGYWRSGAETYSEACQIMIVVAPETQATEDKLLAIARAYVQKFHQEAVLQVQSQVKVHFHAVEDQVDGVPAGGR